MIDSSSDNFKLMSILGEFIDGNRITKIIVGIITILLFTGVIGIIICPWLLMDEISNILIFISGLLGPVLGIMLADYWAIRKTELNLDEFYKEDGDFRYSAGFNMAAMLALILGVATALVGYFVPALEALYNLSWFSGFLVSFVVYYLLMKRKI